jgi:hypothetical protein
VDAALELLKLPFKVSAELLTATVKYVRFLGRAGQRVAEGERGRVGRGRGTIGGCCPSSSLAAGTRLPFYSWPAPNGR